MVEGDGEPLGWVTRLAEAVRAVHARAIRIGGGAAGEYEGRLESACGRPFQHVFGREVFPTVELKAAALFHGLIAGHAFVDGNKRTASLTAITLLIAGRYLDARPTRLQLRFVGELAVETASPPSLQVEDIASWFGRLLGPGPQAAR